MRYCFRVCYWFGFLIGLLVLFDLFVLFFSVGWSSWRLLVYGCVCGGLGLPFY